MVTTVHLKATSELQQRFRVLLWFFRLIFVAVNPGYQIVHTAKNSLRRSSMLPLWMVNKAAAIWLIAFARQCMLLQCPKQKHRHVITLATLLKTK